MKRIVLVLSIFYSTFTFAQIPIEAGAFLGTSVYNGDIDVNFENFLPQMRPAGGVFARYYVFPSIAIRGQMFFTKLYGDEGKFPASAYRKSRGFKFNTSMTEIGLQAEWHLIRLDRSLRFEKDNPFITLYGFGGLSGALFNAKTDYNEPNPVIEDVSPDKDAKYNNKAYSLLGGVGIKLMINDITSIGAEGTARRASTDYLDGVSKLAGPRVNDYYFFTGITFTRMFGGDTGLVGGHRQKSKGGGRYNSRHIGCPSFR
jgi:Domain of unknown function (DUF6089)